MKFDIDPKHPFTSVNIIKEGEEDEYLTEEQTIKFKKVALKCIHYCYHCVAFSVLAFFLDLFELGLFFSFSSIEKVFSVVGICGLIFLFVSLLLLFLEYRKLKKMSKELLNEIEPQEKES